MLKFCVADAGLFLRLRSIPLVRYFFAFKLPAFVDVKDNDLGADLYTCLRYGDVTGKRTYNGRFSDIDGATVDLVSEPFVFHDVAVSSGVTSCELFDKICSSRKAGSFVVSDKFSEIEVSAGVITRVYNSGGKLLNAYAFGILFDPKLSWFFFLSKILYSPISLLRDSGRKHKVSLFIPRLLDYIDSGKIKYLRYDVFETRLKEEFTFVRCMNILIHCYFSEAQIMDGIVNVRNSLKEGGVLLIGRTTVDDVHLASFFRKEGGLLVSLLELNGGAEIRHIIDRINRYQKLDSGGSDVTCARPRP
jgi:hypothetical protein